MSMNFRFTGMGMEFLSSKTFKRGRFLSEMFIKSVENDRNKIRKFLISFESIFRYSTRYCMYTTLGLYYSSTSTPNHTRGQNHHK